MWLKDKPRDFYATSTSVKCDCTIEKLQRTLAVKLTKKRDKFCFYFIFN